MKKILNGILLASLTLFISACANNNRSGMGIAYTNTIDPIFHDNYVRGFNRGEACSKSLFGLFAWGNASIEMAKNNSGIIKVASADTEYFNLFGIYGSACTIIKGE